MRPESLLLYSFIIHPAMVLEDVGNSSKMRNLRSAKHYKLFNRIFLKLIWSLAPKKSWYMGNFKRHLDTCHGAWEDESPVLGLPYGGGIKKNINIQKMVLPPSRIQGESLWKSNSWSVMSLRKQPTGETDFSFS